MILTTEPSFALEAEMLARAFRAGGISSAVDYTDRKVGKKISAASEALVSYIVVLGENELAANSYTLKNLADGSEQSGTIDSLVQSLSS
jgi:histidyl-tRNA synthetase